MKKSREKIKKLISTLLLISMTSVLINVVSIEAIGEANDNKDKEQMYIGENRAAVSDILPSIEKEITAKEAIKEEEVNTESDSDNDGLNDGLEEVFGSDSNKRDTDGDGLDDLIEVKLALNPCNTDTDNNGISDSKEDSDGDGLTNEEEIKLGTNCGNKDTDGDGISDYHEVTIYKTSPTSEDTDDDKINDGDEIKLGLDPNKKSTNGIINDSERKIQQVLGSDRISEVLSEGNNEFIPSISGEVSGLLDRNVFINAYDTTPIENINGLVGGAINIDLKYNDNYSFNLNFNYSNYLKNHDESEIDNLKICHYVDNNFKILDTYKENQCLSTKILEDGIYFILDLKEYSKPEVLQSVETYSVDKSLSSAFNIDSDYDGIEDSSDSKPNSNSFSGTLKTGQATSKVSYTMDYRNFFASKKQYNSNIATISSLFSAAIYSGSTYNGLTLNKFMAQHGIKDIKTYNLASLYSDSDVSEARIGHKKVTYNGVTKEIIVIVVRGTNGTIKEWTSNFDIGSTAQKSKYTDWKVSNNHKGFDVAATRILRCLSEYENASYLDKSAKKTYWVMGHSRGGGIANILGARLIDSSKDVYAYTFAAPNTTTAGNAENTTVYSGIYNILNKDDFVPCLPVTQWGFKHYGKSYTISIVGNYEKEWESLTGINDYNPDTFGMDDTLKEIGKIMDNRNEAYVYSCKCHGDGSCDNITIRNYGMSKESREKAIAKIPSNALSYCKITRYDGGGISGWDFTVCQQPEYFMQLLAAFMANKINAYRFGVELNIAKRYESAKLGIVRSGLGGLAHPHYNESYYLLTKHI